MIPNSTSISKSSKILGVSEVQSVVENIRRSHLCGFDLNLTYPQDGNFQTLDSPVPFDDSSRAQRTLKKVILNNAFFAAHTSSERSVSLEPASPRYVEWKRDTSSSAGTINPFYQCDLLDEIIDYAFNFSLPWSKSHHALDKSVSLNFYTAQRVTMKVPDLM